MNHYAILSIETVKKSLPQAVSKLARAHPELGKPELILLTTDPAAYAAYAVQGIRVIACDYTPAGVQRALSLVDLPIKAVICRGDVYVQYLRKLVPFLPKDVPVASAQALTVATDKQLMRRVWNEQYPEITPRYVEASDPQTAVAAAGKLLRFPVIVKPANLASSLLIEKCDTPAALASCLRNTFTRLEAIYTNERRSDPPKLIVEEYLEGTFYSVDSYVLAPDIIYHTPPIHYLPAKQLGIDDFFLYKRTTLTDLSGDDIRGAEAVAEKAIRAVGLQYTSVHVELVRTGGGWKIIELGPRLGRFRNTMYEQAFGIDHGYNDVLVRLGMVPDLTQTARRFCAAYSLYPDCDGRLVEVSNLAAVRGRVDGVVYYKDMSRPGEMTYQAKHGGHALAEIIFASDSAARFHEDCQWFERHVKVVVTPEGVR